MLFGNVRKSVNLFEKIVHNATLHRRFNADHLKHPTALYCSTGSSYTELPQKLKKSERKPWITSVNELKRKARVNKKDWELGRERIMQPPDNGLLVKTLVPVAHEVHAARAEVISCVSMVAKTIAVYSCSVCGEVHIGDPPHKIKSCNMIGSLASKEHSWKIGGMEHILPLVESFHLYDRIGRTVSHNEQLQVDRIPAILELCIQGGVDMPEYPTRRRSFPAYNVAGKIIDFERRFPKDEAPPGTGINTGGFWEQREKLRENKEPVDSHSQDIKGVAIQGMEAWRTMCSGARELMKKYAVHTCGYCPEIQVGPRGHKVRNCQAYKHQMRDGQHAWQEATIDDLVPIVYVWHVKDRKSGEPLVNGLKKYYGMVPAVVELFAQAGAKVGQEYAGLMREDIVVPALDEEKWVV
ncbi:hypothetical protein M5689_000925 [Euphorbia peplus]|nr:hypothetical protein M5689_000925 [Euphorbia peplus]